MDLAISLRSLVRARCSSTPITICDVPSISAISAYFFYEMPADAGHQVSGRGVVVVPSLEPDAAPEETSAAETANARDQRLG